MRFGVVAAGLLVAMGTTQVAEAQDSPGRLSVFARGGGMSSLTELNEAGTLELATGFAVGGGVAYNLHKNVAIRGDFNYAENDVELNGTDTGESVSRAFYGGAVQLQLPTSSGFMPYIFAGGGAVTVDPDGSDSRTRGQGTFGGGLRYEFGQSRFGVFAEGTTYVSKPQTSIGGSASDKTQWDLAWTGGVSIRLF